MALDSSMLESTPPNRRFVAKLDPPLEVPIFAASEIYRHLGMQLPQEFKMVTYDNLLTSEGSQLDSTPQPGRKKRRMSVQTFDSTGTACTNYHNYTFQAFESVAGRTIRELPFSHPRQIADILPVCMRPQFELIYSTNQILVFPSICFVGKSDPKNHW
jgi:hypothetical protein